MKQSGYDRSNAKCRHKVCKGFLGFFWRDIRQIIWQFSVLQIKRLKAQFSIIQQLEKKTGASPVEHPFRTELIDCFANIANVTPKLSFNIGSGIVRPQADLKATKGPDGDCKVLDEEDEDEFKSTKRGSYDCIFISMSIKYIEMY